MPDLVAKAERASIPPNPPETDRAEDCDPECAWQAMCTTVSQMRAARTNNLPREPYKGMQDDMRLTDIGHQGLRIIQDDYLGLTSLMEAADACTSPCAIQDSALSAVDLQFGPEVQQAINELG